MSEQHADLLQFQLREECLKLGAALFYCSGTVHYDNVIIINNENGINSFLPCKSQGTTDC